jgi:hypothetical protein
LFLPKQQSLWNSWISKLSITFTDWDSDIGWIDLWNSVHKLFRSERRNIFSRCTNQKDSKI